MWCTRWFLPLLILPLPKSPPFVLLLYLLSTAMHAQAWYVIASITIPRYPDLISSQLQLHRGPDSALSLVMLLATSHTRHATVQTLERQHNDFRTRPKRNAPSELHSRRPRRAICGQVLV